MAAHKLRFALGVALQLLVLLAVAGSWQRTLATGTVIQLETVPVDPRDLFRGDYVQLSYKISTLDLAALGSTGSFAPGSTVYVGLEERGPYWEATSVGTTHPGGLAIRGTVWTHFAGSGGGLGVRYGLESYFVPEGKGRLIERAQRPVTVEVSVDGGGRAVIRRLLVDGQPVP